MSPSKIPDDSLERRLASTEPVPGGGAAVARTGAYAAALMVKVLRLSLRRCKDAELAGKLESWREEADRCVETFRDLEDDDQGAFSRLLEALRLRRREPEDPGASERIRKASEGASAVPLRMMEESARLLAVLEEIARLAVAGHVRAEADVGVAADLLLAVVGARWNVNANLGGVGPGGPHEELCRRRDELRSRVQADHSRIVQHLLGILPD